MIIKRNFKNNRKIEKAAALLALTADKGQKAGRCLLAEEMAVLVDAKCEKEQLAIYMQHLSECEKCYKEWLTLKRLADHKTGGEGRVYRLSRIKKYSLLGSALAVAASIAVFINISSPPSFFSDKSLEQALLKQPRSKSALPQTAPPQAEMDSLTKEQLGNGEVPTTDTGSLFMQKAKGISEPVVQSAPRPTKKAAAEQVMADKYAPMDVDIWFAQIHKNCLFDNLDVDFWSKMHLEGKIILEKQAGSLSKNKEQKVSAVLDLLDKMDTEPITEQCRRLLDVLAEEEKSR